MKFLYHILLLVLSCLVACSPPPPPPAAVEPVPHPRQLAWQQMEYYGFLHFNMNTFLNQEWSYGDAEPDQFQPTELDARQWARVAKEAGMSGLIITAKHHDGFCLWPSAYTEYSVKNSTWKDGKGDVIRELADACQEYGLEMGVYLSPWDRNHPAYGQPEYLTYFRNQLTELLTNYGPIFEVWFDGANGGDGYYGGAREIRKVDKQSYYDWPTTIELVRNLQPDAVIFSDAGPDVRWIGNEHGYAYPTTWSPLLREEVYGGMMEYAAEYSDGQENGTHWVPGEADVSIRPGWYYHPNEDDKVKSLQQLLEIYYRSLGQNSNLLLNFPVDRRGLIHETDLRQLNKLTTQLKLDFATDLAAGKSVAATNVRGSHAEYGAALVNDDDPESYWATDDELIQASLTVDLGEPTNINRLLLREYIALGQRIKAFSVEAEIKGRWQPIDTQTTIGFQRILRFPTVEASKLRLNILDAKASPTLSQLQIFYAPSIVDAPEMLRNKAGMVRLLVPDSAVDLYYTTDGTPPTPQSPRYEQPFEVAKPTTVQAIALDPLTQRQSEVATRKWNLSKANWRTFNPYNRRPLPANIEQVIDDDPTTFAEVEVHRGSAQVTIDLGEDELLHGFTYLPDQRRYASRVITDYRFSISPHGKRWTVVSEGEFANILNNPIEQVIRFEGPVEARFIRLEAVSIQANAHTALINELGVLTE
ncbi:MAG: alpha-L-fucosidase [Bacteroidota bacterium]